jgi:uncharacterized protein GlcG (DUF336 family)
LNDQWLGAIGVSGGAVSEDMEIAECIVKEYEKLKLM